jgi:hypothetical protein
MIGDWKGSAYGVNGRRYDYHLFLDNDGRYERTVRGEPDYERRDIGRWEFDDAGQVLRLVSETTDESDWAPGLWWVLSVTTCEDSNVLLVLRQVILASRNLPILFYRVHSDGRGYGTARESTGPS